MSKKSATFIIIAIVAAALISGAVLVLKEKQGKPPKTERSTTSPQETSQTAAQPAIPKPLPEDVIKRDVATQNNHDWQSDIAIRTAKPGPPENRNG